MTSDLARYTTSELLAAGDANSARMREVADEFARRDGDQALVVVETREQVDDWARLTADMARASE